MSFELPQQQNKIGMWLELIDDSLGKHQDTVEKILKNTNNPEIVIQKLSNYMHENQNVTLLSERDSAVKFGTKMPDFVSGEEEVLWNLFIQLRSDKCT